jgi:hypothetical protein
MNNPLRDHGTCENCAQPVHSDVGPSRGWIHTITGNYGCVLGGGNTFAAPLGK